MSTIIAVKDYSNKQTILACDTLCTNGTQVSHRINSKVFSIGAGVYVGCAGSYRLFQLIEYFCKITDVNNHKTHIQKGKEIEFFVKEYVPHCLKIFEEQKYDYKESGGSVLICVNDKILKYEVGNGQIGEYNLPFYAIGSGAKFALGALSALHLKTKIKYDEMVDVTMESAEYFDQHTGIENNKIIKKTIQWEKA